MELFVQSTVLASAAVLVITELLKLVPVAFTSKYPAWVNGICSVIAAVSVSHFSWDLSNLGAIATQALVIAVTAALAYNQFTSQLVNLSGKTVQR
jgi:hypothetical protein